MSGVQSWNRERDIIFERWLENVERLLDRSVYTAWCEGYSVREFAGEGAPRSAPPLAPH
jgi:hypothetical protein